MTNKKRIELEEAGIPMWIMHSRIDLEVRIRSVLESQGIQTNYEQIVSERQSEYPKPRETDKKLKEILLQKSVEGICGFFS